MATLAGLTTDRADHLDLLLVVLMEMAVRDPEIREICAATLDPGADREPKGLKLGGLAVPGKWAGTFRRDGERTFWNVSKPGSTVAVELRDEKLRRLMLTVDEPRELVDRINAAIRVRPHPAQPWWIQIRSGPMGRKPLARAGSRSAFDS